MVPVEGMLNVSNLCSTGIPRKESINQMVPLLGVHVAAASVKATVRCPHWVACLAKKHR